MKLSVPPKLRATLLAFHVVAVIALSLPGPQVASSARWNSRLMQKDMADWAAQLRAIGINVTAEEFGRGVRSLAEGYVALRNQIVSPFDLYARVTQARQGWAMFASPQRHPAELRVDGLVGGRWQPLVRPHDPEAAFMSDYLRHNRVRKFQGRFARALRNGYYDDFAAFLARRAFHARPDVERVQVSLFSYAALGPEQVRSGQKIEGESLHLRVFERKTFETERVTALLGTSDTVAGQ